MKLVITALAFSLVAGVAQAQDWHAVAVNQQYMMVFDRSAVTASGDVRAFSLRRYRAVPEWGREEGQAPRWIQYTAILTEVNCASRQFRTTGIRQHDFADGLVNAADSDGPWEEVQAGGLPDTLIQITCNDVVPEGGAPLGANLELGVAAFYDTASGEEE